MRVLAVTCILWNTLLATTSWALQDSSTIPVDQVKLLCASSITAYVSYNVKVTSGSLSGVYLSPTSNALANQELLLNSPTNSTEFTILFDRANSCAPNEFLLNPPRQTSCSKGTITPSKTISINEPYCLVLDNVNGTMPATVSTTYEFTNSRTSTSTGPFSSDGLPGRFNSVTTIFKHSASGYLFLSAMAALLAYVL
jgi:hypothetical protein